MEQTYRSSADLKWKINNSISCFELPPRKSSQLTDPGIQTQRFKHKDRFSTGVIQFNNPPPGSYNVIREISSSQKGRSVGISRDQIMSQSILRYMNKYPGPGSYQEKSTLASNHYSMRKKTNTGFLSNLSKYPGPGTYENIESLTKSGKFFYSRYKTQGVPVILPDKEFISPNRLNVPGPGTYKPRHHFTDQTLDKFKRSKGGRFSKSKKMVRHFDKNPGPGSYEPKTMFK